VICGSDTVTFFAVKPEAARALAAHLREFGPTLPEGVVQGVTPEEDRPPDPASDVPPSRRNAAPLHRDRWSPRFSP
jgi:hypothetical protein